jgi:DNA polymerase-3 subunit chi
MTEVSFYLLSTEYERQRQLFACKLIEKAYRSGCYCSVLTNSEADSQVLDELLWTFRPTSFIPHEIYRGDVPEFANTILITDRLIPQAWQTVIINLSLSPPADLSHTARLLEILDNNQFFKQAGRERYRYYKQLGLSLKTHQIT